MPDPTPAAATTLITPVPVLVNAGLRCVLHFFTGPSATDLDSSTNYLYGYKIDDFTIGGTVIEQVDVPSEEIMKLFASGLATGGDVDLKFAFDPEAGSPPLVRPKQGIVYTPQAVLWFGFLTEDKTGLVAYGELPVNIAEFGSCSLPKGQPGISGMKLKQSGEGAILGRTKVGKCLLYNPT